jgi:small subunit ribosomal protein S8
MSVTDPIADMFSALRNAAMAGSEEVTVPYSRLKERIANLLKKEGFVDSVRKFKEKGSSRLSLAIKLTFNKEGNVKMTHIKRISRSSQRVYSSAPKLKSPPIGIKIISTSRGLLTEKEARKRQLGGEVMGEVW